MTLLTQTCRANAAALDAGDIAALLPQVPAWTIADGKLQRSFAFRNYYDTMAFVNALAWISHHQDHHPELIVTYKECAVRYNTHSAGGALSDNDFICAARADALYAQRGGA
ncbi:4a-hydroxytetrahydrobiopterin dehydratase [Massilia atriviolacea]|uniref:Putative pterin-4-alpha-carbinolamine dehydratase n=1 Tax=Massilia atriviolacea TaxID=2495579 RepID=A0A430HIB6_9BURK|nr:4a-hydroxytetrahydrobiopterin dehydratase [Massilia atriviolacea]RSZ57256.1 4a-hydroxytetrahydrobiopterin dehydratase [Massilia atriviolacea]